MALNPTQANILAKELFLEVSSSIFFKRPKELNGEIYLVGQAVEQQHEAYLVDVFQEIVSVLQE